MPDSYNGWPASKDPKAIDIDQAFTAAGRKFPGGVKRGPVSVVFRYLIEQFDKRVEEVDLYDAGDEWGWHYKPSANSPSKLSCHSSGTALDVNATRHPNRTPASRTFTAGQIREIKAILAELGGVVRWLGEARTPDPMHFEIAGTPAEVARVAGRILSGSHEPAPTPANEENDVIIITSGGKANLLHAGKLIQLDADDRLAYLSVGVKEAVVDSGMFGRLKTAYGTPVG